ncbi:MAG: hypothetical protein ACI9EF_002146 [Pseudohongiellaceae bacterium]|jgi:hypothetical protein
MTDSPAPVRQNAAALLVLLGLASGVVVVFSAGLLEVSFGVSVPGWIYGATAAVLILGAAVTRWVDTTLSRRRGLVIAAMAILVALCALHWIPWASSDTILD